MPWLGSYVACIESITFQQVLIFRSKNKLVIRPKDEGNSIRFMNFCEQFFYKNPSLLS